MHNIQISIAIENLFLNFFLFPLYPNTVTLLSHNPVDRVCPGLHLLLVSVPCVIPTHHLATPTPAIILQQCLDVDSCSFMQIQAFHPVLQTQHQAAGGRLVQIHVGYP